MKKGIVDYVFYFAIIVTLLSLCYFFFLDKKGNESLVLEDDNIVLAIGENKKINIRNNKTEGELNYLSTDSSIAIVSSDGIITAISSGSTSIIINLTLSNGEVISKQCSVKVLSNSTDEYVFDNKLLLLNLNEQVNLTLKENISLEVMDDSIISLNENTIIGKKVGKTTISAKKNGKILNSLVVYVKENVKTVYIDNPLDIKTEKEEIILKVGESVNVKVETNPKDISLDFLEWESSDEAVVQVSNGVLKGIKYGSVIVTVKTLNGIKTSFLVKVVS